MALRCLCGHFMRRPSDKARTWTCGRCGAAWKVPASKARRSEVGRKAAIARAKSQTPEERSTIARNAALAKWAKHKAATLKGE